MGRLENEITTMLKGLSDGIDRETREDIQKLENLENLKKEDIPGKAEDSYFLDGRYETEKAHKALIKELAKKQGYIPSQNYAEIYYHYNDILSYLSEIFKETIGFTCSTDRARFVLDNVLEFELKGKCRKLLYKSGRHSYSDPYWRNFKDWQDLVLTCPIINPSQALKHSQCISNIYDNLNFVIRESNLFEQRFLTWLKNSIFKDHELTLVRRRDPSKNKTYKASELLNLQGRHTAQAVKYYYPEMMATYRNQLKKGLFNE